MGATRIYLRSKKLPVLVKNDAAEVADVVRQTRIAGTFSHLTAASRHLGEGDIFLDPNEVVGIRQTVEVAELEPEDTPYPETGEENAAPDPDYDPEPIA